tara:strand:- start:734 stop:1801 length:1068 start_codon:yes stop_codon:yes gene_type:complete
MEKCNICEYEKLILVDFNNIFLRTESKNKNVHDYKNFICKNCGVLNQSPQMSEEQLSKYYNSDYRNTGHQLTFNEKVIDFPLKFDQTGISFQRFHYFQKIIEKTNLDIFKKNILDFGSYQGSFLYACKKFYDSYTIGYDYNDEGLKFSKNFLEIDEVFKTKDIYSDLFPKKIKICTLIHVFEHLGNPNKFLKHVHKNILEENGYIYIEVPDIQSSHYSDPTHCFTYSQDSLKYVLEKNDFEILYINNHKIFGKIDKNIPRRNFQYNLHCLAKKNLKKSFNEFPNQGYKIYIQSKKNHSKVLNKYILNKTKELLKDLVELLITICSRLINYFSSRISISFYEKIKINISKFLRNFK